MLERTQVVSPQEWKETKRYVERVRQELDDRDHNDTADADLKNEAPVVDYGKMNAVPRPVTRMEAVVLMVLVTVVFAVCVAFAVVPLRDGLKMTKAWVEQLDNESTVHYGETYRQNQALVRHEQMLARQDQALAALNEQSALLNNRLRRLEVALGVEKEAAKTDVQPSGPQTVQTAANVATSAPTATSAFDVTRADGTYTRGYYFSKPGLYEFVPTEDAVLRVGNATYRVPARASTLFRSDSPGQLVTVTGSSSLQFTVASREAP